ncbi:hypothetical protein SRABI106_01995 [Rahnella aquatilis]|nr:hypothetical protein SRABI106_01995 [Rahnella aquatilis]
MYRYAVSIGTRLKLIGHAQFEIALMPEIRVIVSADIARALFDQHAFFKVQAVLRLRFPPGIKMTRRHHFLPDALFIEQEQGFVINQNIAATGFVFQLFHFGAQTQVSAEERMTGLPVAFHQRMPDKQFP